MQRKEWGSQPDCEIITRAKLSRSLKLVNVTFQMDNDVPTPQIKKNGELFSLTNIKEIAVMMVPQ